MQEEILGEVKAGDELALQGYSYGSSSDYRIVTVDHVTKTGRIALKNYPTVFDKDGVEIRGKGRAHWGTRVTLHRVTDEIKASIRRKNMINVLEHVRWDEVPQEVLEAAYAAFKIAQEVKQEEEKTQEETL